MKTNRQKFNRKILSLLSQIVEDHSDLRFNQLLEYAGVVEDMESGVFYEESETTYERMVEKNDIE